MTRMHTWTTINIPCESWIITNQSALWIPYNRKDNQGITTVISPWLWKSAWESNMVKWLIGRLNETCNCLVLDHPCYGLNKWNPEHEHFSLTHCRDTCSAAIQHILSLPNTQKIALVGNSLGFFTLLEALKVLKNDSRIKILLGKSGVPDYPKLLNEMIQRAGGKGRLLKMINLGQDGICSIVISPWQQPIEVHRNFIDTAPDFISGVENVEVPIEVWHGTNDIVVPYTHASEAAEQNDWTLHTLEAWHGLLPETDWDIYRRLYMVLSSDSSS